MEPALTSTIPIPMGDTNPTIGPSGRPRGVHGTLMVKDEVMWVSEVAVIFPLAEMQVGDTYVLNDIPLHLTVLSNARLDEPASAFVEVVRGAAENQAPFMARALDFEMFGPNADILVTEVTVVPPLRLLHEALSDAVRQRGGRAVEPMYWGAGFRAHVTRTQRGSRIESGAEVRLDTLALIDCTNAIRRVVWVEPLADPVLRDAPTLERPTDSRLA